MTDEAEPKGRTLSDLPSAPKARTWSELSWLLFFGILGGLIVAALIIFLATGGH